MNKNNLPGQESGSTSISLLERAGKNDNVAWQRLVDLYAPIVYLRARQSWNLSTGDSENIGQEVFTAIARKLSDFERNRSGSFRKWVRTIVDNKCRDHLRKQAALDSPGAIGGSHANQLIQNIATESYSDDETVQAKTERSVLMKQAMLSVESEFSDRDWQIFWKVVVDLANYQAVAEEFGVSDNVVYLAVSRIRKRLKAVFEDLLDDDLLGDQG